MLEDNTKYQKSFSSTSLPCSWLPPSFRNVPFSQLADINFATPQVKRKKIDSDGTSVVKDKVVKTQVPTSQELNSLYKEISVAGKPVILSLIPGYSEPYIPLTQEGFCQPPYDIKYLEVSYPDLLNKCEHFFNSYTITSTQAKVVEERTKDQAHCKIWFHQRSGRLTASKLRSACCTDET